MKKQQLIGLLGLLMMSMVGLIIGVVADDGDEPVTNTTEIEAVIEEPVEVEEIQEEIVEEAVIEEPEEEVEQVVEEPTEPEVVEEEETSTFDPDELQYYLTTTLSDAEYQAYFDEIIVDKETLTIREIEFDAHIMFVNQSEKYKTRCELMLASGDYNEDGSFSGPYIKTRDIAYIDLEGAHEGSNVRVRATIDGYDMDGGYLKITIRDITLR